MSFEDPMQVRFETGVMHVDGRNPETGERFSKTEPTYRIEIGFPQIGTIGVLASNTDKQAVFDRAISRVETMLANLKVMKQANLSTTTNL
jgi:hypothetical protein